MAAKRDLLIPFMAIHPGSILREELKERGLKQKNFAEMIGMQTTHLSELVNGKRGISEAVAEKLEDALGIPSLEWMKLQNQYNYDKKLLQKKGTEKQTVKDEI
jgi:HTH-type transcriptional regulator / antitoxin HigA